MGFFVVVLGFFWKVAEARYPATQSRSQVVHMLATFPRSLRCQMGSQGWWWHSPLVLILSPPLLNWVLCQYLGKISMNSLDPNRKRWPSFLVLEPNLAYQKWSESCLVSWKMQFYIGCSLTNVILLCMRVWLEDHDYNLFPYSYHWIMNVCISWLAQN